MRPSAPRQFSLALAAAFTVFFAPQLFTAGVPYYRDTLVTVLPFRHYIHQRLRNFELPQWYPREGLGVPFIGQIATGTFHPQTALFLPLRPIQAVKWNLLLMYALALAGSFRFARSLNYDRASSAAAALSFAFGGYGLGVSHNLVYAGAHALLPWVAAIAVRCGAAPAPRHAVGLGCCWALLLLGGDAQSFVMVPLVLAAVLAARPEANKRTAVLLFASAGALAALLAAPEVLPALTVGTESLRAVGERSPTMGRTWALHPMRVFELVTSGFVPDLVRNEFTGTFFGGGRALWATTLFFGAGPLLLATAGATRDFRRCWPFALCALLSMWLALGDHGGLLPLVSNVVPLLGKFRFPEKFMSLFWLFSIPLVAAGAAAVRDSRRLGYVAFVGAAVSLALAFTVGSPRFVELLRGSAQASRDFDVVVSAAWRSGLIAASLTLLATAVVLLRVRPEHRVIFVTALVFVELYRGNSAHLPLIPPDLITTPNPLAAAIESGARVVRDVGVSAPSTVSLGDGETWAIGARRSFKPNVAQLDGVATFETNTPATSWRYGLLMSGRDLPPRPDLFHGCYRVTIQPVQPVVVDAETGLAVEKLPCFPRTFVGPTVAVGNAFDGRRWLETSAGPIIAVEGGKATEATGAARIAVDLPERVEVEVTMDRAGALYLADSFASGWRASVEGAEVKVYPANVAARAVYLPEGQHRVVFEYRTPSLHIGLALGLIGWMIVLGVAVARINLRLLRQGRSRTL